MPDFKPVRMFLRILAILTGIAFLLVIVIVAIAISSYEPSDSSPNQTRTSTDRAKTNQAKSNQSKTSYSAPKAEHPIYGEQGVLRMDNGGRVPIAPSERIYDRLQELANVNDVTGIEQLIRSGALWMVDSETPVLVINTDWTRFEVRILDGPRAGASGYVMRDFVWKR